jgi:hypothetical protein
MIRPYQSDDGSSILKMETAGSSETLGPIKLSGVTSQNILIFLDFIFHNNVSKSCVSFSLAAIFNPLKPSGNFTYDQV